MNNQQQTIDPEKVITRLVNKIAMSELEEAKRDVLIDDLRAKIQQLSQSNQQLSSENQQLREENKELKTQQPAEEEK